MNNQFFYAVVLACAAAINSGHYANAWEVQRESLPSDPVLVAFLP